MCELLRANLYEFQKYNRDNGDELYFTLPRLQKIAHQVCQALHLVRNCLPPHAVAVHFGAAAIHQAEFWCSSSKANFVTCTRGLQAWCLTATCWAEDLLSAMLQLVRLCLPAGVAQHSFHAFSGTDSLRPEA